MKKILSFLLIVVFMRLYAHADGEIPEPYCSICDLPFDNHGWFGNQQQLEQCFSERPIQVVIEIGSWLGLSTRFLAEKIPDTGKVYAVDTWLGTQQEPVHMQDPRLPRLFQLFLSNIKHANLTHKIVPIRMKSLEAAKALNVKADLIYLDAAHDEASVYQDILNWYPHLQSGGIMCGDDWLWDTVRRAVVRAAVKLNRTIHAQGNFWRFE